MKKLNLNIGLIKKIAATFGLDPETLTRDQVQQLVRAKMTKKIPAVAADLVADGKTYAKVGEANVIRGAVFRLWRDGVLTFPGGGHLADVIRDSHDDKIIAELALPVTEATPIEEIVRLAMESTLELAF